MPTWLVYRVLFRRWLPEGHPLKRPISLRDWKLGQTPLCRQYDRVLTVCLVCELILVGSMVLR